MSKHFMDIGANVGQTFDWLATQPNDYKDHQWWLFEPSPRHFAALMARCEEQAKRGYHIFVCPFGFSEEPGARRIFEKDDPQGDSFNEKTTSDHTPKNTDLGYAVVGTTFRLSDFIRGVTKEGDEITLDIDAEGSEYVILGDLLSDDDALKRVRRILCEFHFVDGIDAPKMKRYYFEQYLQRGIMIEIRGFVP